MENRITIGEILTPGGLVKRIMNLPIENCSDEALPTRAFISMVTMGLQVGLYAGVGYLLTDSAATGAYSSGFVAMVNLIANSSRHLD